MHIIWFSLNLSEMIYRSFVFLNHQIFCLSTLSFFWSIIIQQLGWSICTPKVWDDSIELILWSEAYLGFLLYCDSNALIPMDMLSPRVERLRVNTDIRDESSQQEMTKLPKDSTGSSTWINVIGKFHELPILLPLKGGHNLLLLHPLGNSNLFA